MKTFITNVCKELGNSVFVQRNKGKMHISAKCYYYVCGINITITVTSNAISTVYPHHAFLQVSSSISQSELLLVAGFDRLSGTVTKNKKYSSLCQLSVKRNSLKITTAWFWSWKKNLCIIGSMRLPTELTQLLENVLAQLPIQDSLLASSL